MLPTLNSSSPLSLLSAPEGSEAPELMGSGQESETQAQPFKSLLMSSENPDNAPLGHQKLAAMVAAVNAEAGETLPLMADVPKFDHPEQLTGEALMAYLMANAGHSKAIEGELSIGTPENADALNSAAEVLDDLENMTPSTSEELVTSSEIGKILQADVEEAVGEDESLNGVELKAVEADSETELLDGVDESLVIGEETTSEGDEVLPLKDVNVRVASEEAETDSSEPSELNGNSKPVGDVTLDASLNPSASVEITPTENSLASSIGVAIPAAAASPKTATKESSKLEAPVMVMTEEEANELELKSPIVKNEVPTVIGTDDKLSVKFEGAAMSPDKNSEQSMQSARLAAQVPLDEPLPDLEADVDKFNRTTLETISSFNKQASKTVLTSQQQTLLEEVNRPMKLVNAGVAMADKIQTMVAGELKHALIRLDPPELGALEIRVQVQQDQTQIQIVTQSSQVREALEQQSARLRESLAQQGLDLSNLDVSDQSMQRENGEGSDRNGDLADGELEESEQVNKEAEQSINIGLVDQYV